MLVYGTLVPSCLLERPWGTGERALLSRASSDGLGVAKAQPRTGWKGEGGTPCTSDADDSKIEPVHDPITQTQTNTPPLKTPALSSCNCCSAFKGSGMLFVLQIYVDPEILLRPLKLYLVPFFKRSEDLAPPSRITSHSIHLSIDNL